MQLLARCRAEGLPLTLNQVLRAKSLVHLAQNIEPSSPLDHGSEQIDTLFDLSPVQRLYFGVKGNEEGSHFNQSWTVRLSPTVPINTLRLAFDAIVNCHSMLRARFSKTDRGQWRQFISSNDTDAYSFNVHSIPSATDSLGLMSATQLSFNLQKGPVFAVDIFNVRSEEQIVFIAAHHLVVDLVSWQIILGDLEDIINHGTTHVLQKELPFQTWCERQTSHARGITQKEALLQSEITAQPADVVFWGMDKRSNVYGDVERDGFSLDQDVSALILDNHKALRTDVVDLLVASILHSFSRIFLGKKPPTIFNESHGREPWESSRIDLSRTVGWFTTVFPITVGIDDDEDDVIHTVRQVKDLRRKAKDNGRSHFAHQFSVEENEENLAQYSPMEVLFNYLGKTQEPGTDDSLFKSVNLGEEDDTTIPDVGAQTTRLALFEITASTTNGQIHMDFLYNRWMKNRKGIRRWITECQRTLEDVAVGIVELKTPQPTLADFPLLPLESYDRLDRVMKTLPTVGIPSYDEIEDIFPCSAIQEGILLSQIKDPTSYWSFINFEVISTQSQVDQQRLAEAWTKVVHRHQALRTIMTDSVCKGGVFDQIVVKNPRAGLVSYRCCDSELTAKLDSIDYRSLNGKQKPNLPHQAAIVATESGRVVVKIIVNHAVIDGASLAIIGRDLQEAYEGKLPDEEGPLYSDYIRYLQSLDAPAAIKFWKDGLRGVQPCYFPTTPQQGAPRQLRSIDMKFSRFAEVRTFAENNNITLANILLAAWALTLHAYTGTPDICYGYLTSGRNVPVDGIDNAVGAFINILALRISITPASSVLEMMQKVQNYYIESLPHQHCSLAQFQHDLGLAGKPLFNTAISIQNTGAAQTPEHNALDIQFEQLDGHDPSEFAITVNIDTSRKDEAVRFTYWTDAIHDNEAENVSSLMANILTQTLADANQAILNLDLTHAKAPAPPDNNNLMSRILPVPHARPGLAPSMSFSTSPGSHAIIPLVSEPSSIQAQDLGNLIRSIVQEIVPQVVDQILTKSHPHQELAGAQNRLAARPSIVTAGRRASTSRGQVNFETGSVRSRRLSITSNAESRIQTAVDLMTVAGAIATEALQASEVVEKKLLRLWSELLDMTEDTIDKDDSFFVGGLSESGCSQANIFSNWEETVSSRCD
jgi:non-ribosomal peptide synthase protein (TIGR01720 family)